MGMFVKRDVMSKLTHTHPLGNVMLCDTWQSFHLEIEFLKSYFRRNAYPENQVLKLINKFLNNRLTPQKEKIPGVEKQKWFHKIPFINDKAAKFVNEELTKIFKRFYPQIDFKPVFYNNSKIHGFLKHKERLPDALSSGVCYKFTCGECGAIYIGSTLKCLRTRAGEHFGISPRTGNLLARPVQSNIREHLYSCMYTTSLENFKVLRSFSYQEPLRIFESLEIEESKPDLNVDLSSFQLFL